MKNICVGIAGPSASGKSTIARMLVQGIGAKLFCLDDYFIANTARPVVNGFSSFERPEQYDGTRLAAQVAMALETGPVVAEGFLLFKYHAILALCHLKFFIAIPSEVIVSRRRSRRDMGHGKAAGVERAFDAHGVHEWEWFGKAQADIPGVLSIDGNQPIGLVIRDFQSHLPSLNLVAPVSAHAGRR